MRLLCVGSKLIEVSFGADYPDSRATLIFAIFCKLVLRNVSSVKCNT